MEAIQGDHALLLNMNTFLMFLSGMWAVHLLGFQVSALNVHDGSLYCIFAAFQSFHSYAIKEMQSSSAQLLDDNFF